MDHFIIVWIGKVESSVGLDKLLYARTLGAIAKERAESSDRIIRILDVI